MVHCKFIGRLVLMSFIVIFCSCEDHRQLPINRSRVKSVYWIEATSAYSRQQDVYKYDKDNKLINIATDFSDNGKYFTRQSNIDYVYDSQNRLISFDYNYLVQLNILYRLGFVRNFVYDDVLQMITITEVNHDPIHNDYIYKSSFNSLGQLTQESLYITSVQYQIESHSYKYENNNVVEELVTLTDRSPIVYQKYLYEYDDKVNPLYRIEGPQKYLSNQRQYSKNNLKKVTLQTLAADKATVMGTSTREFTLTYDTQGVLTRSLDATPNNYEELNITNEPY